MRKGPENSNYTQTHTHTRPLDKPYLSLRLDAADKRETQQPETEEVEVVNSPRSSGSLNHEFAIVPRNFLWPIFVLERIKTRR